MTPPPTLAELIETVRRDSASGQSLDQLVAAAAAAAQLTETTDALLGYFVDQCRQDGRSWTEISGALGVTKQAVHKRFAGAMADQIIAASPAPTFERFTERARRVVVATRTAAADLGDDFAGPEHILLALFSDPDALSARVLALMDVTEGHVREAIAAARADAPESAAGEAGEAVSERPFNGPAKQVLRGALTVALRFGHNYIGTEHLLLGLYEDADSLAAQILTSAGAGAATARAHVTDLLRGFGSPGVGGA